MSKTIEEPRNARSQRTRDALLAATRSILENDGFEALTMNAVAARAGVTRRAVYLHFNSRSELVSALFGYIAEQEDLAGSLAEIRNAPDAVQALRAWVRHIASYHPRVMLVDRAVQRVEHVDTDAARHRATVSEAQLAECRRIATALATEGKLAEPWTVETATDMLWSLIATDLFERLLTSRTWSPATVEEHLWALCQATFVTPDRRR